MKKALIVYASKTGTTQDAAAALADKLGMQAELYDCRSSKKGLTPPIDESDVVILGTSMYMGSPMREFKRFLAAHRKELEQKPLAFFTCGIGTQEEDEPYLRKHLPEALKKEPLLYRHLGGELRFDRMGGFARKVMKEYADKADKHCIDNSAIESLGSEISTRYGDSIS